MKKFNLVIKNNNRIFGTHKLYIAWNVARKIKFLRGFFHKEEQPVSKV